MVQGLFLGKPDEHETHRSRDLAGVQAVRARYIRKILEKSVFLTNRRYIYPKFEVHK